MQILVLTLGAATGSTGGWASRLSSASAIIVVSVRTLFFPCFVSLVPGIR